MVDPSEPVPKEYAAGLDEKLICDLPAAENSGVHVRKMPGAFTQTVRNLIQIDSRSLSMIQFIFEGYTEFAVSSDFRASCMLPQFISITRDIETAIPF